MIPAAALKQRILPSIPQSLTVFVFWLLMAEDSGPANLVMAALLALLMPLVAARLEREFARLGKLWILVPFGLMVLYDILIANLTVAKQVLGSENKLNSGFVWMPLEMTNIHGISALASVITLTPGTVSAELSPDRRHLLIHYLSADDPEALAANIKARYEAPLHKVFP